MSTKVSVILPCYNGGRWLEAAVRSVLAQSHTNLELIVVNDGSTDNSAEIMSHHVDDKRVLCVYQANQGFSGAINRGIRESGSDYIAFIGQDDCWLPNKLGIQMRYIESTDLVFSGYYAMDCSGRISDKVMPKVPRLSSRKQIVRKLFLENFIPFETVLVRKECLLRAGLFDENLRAFSDHDMWIRLIDKIRLRYLGAALVKKRIHENQLSKRVDDTAGDEILIIKKSVKEYPYLIGDVPTKLSQIYYGWGLQVGRQGDKERAERLLSLSISYNPSNRKAILARRFPTIFDAVRKDYDWARGLVGRRLYNTPREVLNEEIGQDAI